MSGWEDPIIFHRVIVDLRGVEGVRNLLNASPPIWLIGQAWVFEQWCGYCRVGRIQLFLVVIVDLRGVEGVKNLVNASRPIWLIWLAWAVILSGWEDPIIFRRIIVDLRGVEDLKISCECFYCMAYWTDLSLCTMLHCHS